MVRLLFTISINDQETGIDSDVSKFVDDIKIIGVIELD